MLAEAIENAKLSISDGIGTEFTRPCHQGEGRAGGWHSIMERVEEYMTLLKREEVVESTATTP